ncbi:putative GEM-like protein 8 [Vicia villosa]|uniref:putative GEM-like protein 8 n=1 Tax=Vicia villosa TaxID=3911 RepID=UPI00273B59B3|nr:putative GEM-like protein 8 [Vicia villosa]
MKTSFLNELLNGIYISSIYPTGKSSTRYLLDSSSIYNKSITKSKQGKFNSVMTKMNIFGRKSDGFAHGVREHVRLGPKITETVKGKLKLGVRILQVGGVEKVFMQLFSVKDGEKLLKASHCYISTTSGPIAGLLYISTHKVAFCSDKSIKTTSPKGELIRVQYKVSIPHEKIEQVNQSQNVMKPSEKYIEIVTVDGFDFWFMGFFNYRKALRYLQQAISQSHREKL